MAADRHIIEESIGATARDIRELSRDQVDLWRQLPYLGLQIEGTHGFGGYQSLFETGIFKLASGAIDCDTGDIFIDHAPDSQAEVDAQVLRTYTSDRYHLDAEKHVRRYRLLAADFDLSEPTGSMNREQLIIWRKQMAKQLALTTLFDRNIFNPPVNKGFMRNRIDELQPVAS